MKTSTWLMLAAAAAGGYYAFYQRNKTGQWPWESLGLPEASTGGGQWTVSLYDASRTMSVISQWDDEVLARAKASAQLAACPTCKITITTPSGNVLYQVNG